MRSASKDMQPNLTAGGIEVVTFIPCLGLQERPYGESTGTTS